jgi:membrane protein DedA with SNARE-associated domain
VGDVEHLVGILTHFIDREGYAALFVIMALGNIGIPVGTEIVMPIAGAFVAKGHLSSLWLTALVGMLGEVAGAAVLYGIGYCGGRPFVARWGKYVGLSLHKLDLAHGFYERYGKKTVFICRFIPVVRGVASLPAGISRMQKRYFIAYTAAGSAIFCLGLAALGNALGGHLDDALPWIKTSGYLIAALAVAAAVIFYFVQRRRAESREAA